jgi:pimeloyl-ACP methyl ester carboxylesterase
MADFPIEKSFYQHLLSKGWMIAYSSFRRSGFIIKDAVEDMNLLRRHIIVQFREPEKIIVLGTSMGAAIGTLIAETHPNDYDAVLNLGAAFSKKNPEETVIFTYNPKESGDGACESVNFIQFGEPGEPGTARCNSNL